MVVEKQMSCSIINSTINQIAKYTPDIKNGIFPPRQPIKLWLGLADENGNEYLIPQGIFFLCDPTLTSNMSESIITLDMVDAFGLFD